MAEATGLYLANIETGDTSQFTSVVQEGSNTFTALAAAAMHGSYGVRALFDGTNNDCHGIYTFTARGELYARLYFKFSSDFNAGVGNLSPLEFRSGISLRIYPRMVVSGGVITLNRFYHYSDSGAVYASVSQVVSKDVVHYLEMHFKASSAAGANDGVAQLWFDGTLLSDISGIDSDTVSIDRIYAGLANTMVPTVNSYFDLDDIKMDTAYIGAYAESGAAVTGALAEASKKQADAITTITSADISGTLAEASRKQADSISATNVAPVVIIDHTFVEKYSTIPEEYIEAIKTNGRWFDLPGESHSYGYRYGLAFLEDLDARFAVVNTEAGTPENATVNDHLRSSRASWGDYDSASGWIYTFGEEDWYTNAASITAVKRHIKYCHDNGFGLSTLGFGWCWDMTQVNVATVTKDPVYKCGWAGESVAGPEGNLQWGLDAEDTAITGNSVCLDTYLAATQEYIDYCDANGYPTKVFFTTGPVDGYTGERGYQRHLKHERIRAYVEAHGGYLFDYADIEAWDDAGTQNLQSWADGDGGAHAYQMIAADNLLDFDGGNTGDYGHIGQRGVLRLGKAVWVMLALMEGWNGNPSGSSNGVIAENQHKQDDILTGTVENAYGAAIAESTKKQDDTGSMGVQTLYIAGSVLRMPSQDRTLYAKFIPE